MFKKRITPFACVVVSVVVCIATCVATLTHQNIRRNAEINEQRQETANWSEFFNTVKNSGSNSTDDFNVASDKYIKLATLINRLEQNYVNEYDQQQVWDNIYRVLAMSIGDDYSQYFTAEEYAALLNDQDGNFVGIGVHATFDVDTNGIYVFGVMKDSPAELGGVQKGDIIVAAEGIEATDKNYYTMLDTIRGEPGTEVSITVLRGEEKLELKLTRAAVPSENVIYENLGNGIAYIKILTFSETTVTSQFVSQMSLAQSEGCTKFIFDVRNNIGGSLDEIRKTLDLLLPQGPIINIVTKDGKTTTLNSDENCIKAEKMVVLCNEVTASAAELFTAALRDYELAEIVGVKTFGKGTMQTTFNLEDGSAIKMSTAFYNPPSNESYDGKGITPDYEVKLDEKWESRFYKMPKEEDAQLQKAISLITSTN